MLLFLLNYYRTNYIYLGKSATKSDVTHKATNIICIFYCKNLVWLPSFKSYFCFKTIYWEIVVLFCIISKLKKFNKEFIREIQLKLFEFIVLWIINARKRKSIKVHLPLMCVIYKMSDIEFKSSLVVISSNLIFKTKIWFSTFE